MRLLLAPALALVPLAHPGPATAQEAERVLPRDVPAAMSPAEGRVVLDRSLAFLVATQHPDGSWGHGAPDSVMELGFAKEAYYSWNYAANLIACLALLECEESPERRKALERGLDWCCRTRMTYRGDDWDNDAMWTALYGVVALTRAARDARFQSPEWRAKIAARGRKFFEVLRESQVIEGGWGYYDDPPFSNRPKWATSFATACALPAVRDAQALGWNDDPRVLARAQAYVERCRLPGGSFEYDLNHVPRFAGGEHINQVQGSLGRIQVCNWALASLGVKWVTQDRIRDGLEHFFRDHRFLDAARLRPIPHEAYFANAGYFYFFGHYYAALAIQHLPLVEREAFHARLRPHLGKTQRADGSASDFLESRYDVLASTAFLALALDAGLDDAAAAGAR